MTGDDNEKIDFNRYMMVVVTMVMMMMTMIKLLITDNGQMMLVCGMILHGTQTLHCLHSLQ